MFTHRPCGACGQMVTPLGCDHWRPKPHMLTRIETPEQKRARERKNEIERERRRAKERKDYSARKQRMIQSGAIPSWMGLIGVQIKDRRKSDDS